MEESADQANPPESPCEQSKDIESKPEEATELLDGDEANESDKLTDLKMELDWGAGVGAESLRAGVTTWQLHWNAPPHRDIWIDRSHNSTSWLIDW